MKALPLFLGAVAMTVPALAQTAAKPPQTLSRAATEFNLVVRAPYVKTAPLFGPEGERAWAGKDWNPEFLYPQPAHDEQGAVFTIHHGTMQAVWINTIFDVETRRFQYVYFLPGIMVTVIDVRFELLTPASTGVHVVYTRTAITQEGNEHVAAMATVDRKAGKEWQQAIDRYLQASPQP